MFTCGDRDSGRLGRDGAREVPGIVALAMHAEELNDANNNNDDGDEEDDDGSDEVTK